MESVIYGQLFGHPQIFVDGEPRLFSYSKINALLYYLLVNKTASRDEVASLLWPEMAEKNAKKNLRNTIYQTNKALGGDYICSPNKMLLLLNPELDISCDVDLFTENPKENLDLYVALFLKGFFLKESEGFESWRAKMSLFYEKKFVNECYRKVSQDLEDEAYEDVQKNLQKLISMDEYDERNYQLLMTYYQKNNRNEKVIEVYYELADILNMELGISPSQETREMFEKSLFVVNEREKNETRRFDTAFFGRLAEIQALEINFNRFMQEEKATSIAIKGEAGVGKKSLVNRVLDNVNTHFYILESQCYEVESAYELRAWRKIINQLAQLIEEHGLVKPNYWQQTINRFFPTLDDFPFEAAVLEEEKPVDLNFLSQVIIEAIRKVSHYKKIVIVFKDIHWLDERSCQLLVSVMLHLNNEKGLFVLTLQDKFTPTVTNVLTTLERYELLQVLVTDPLTLVETRQFAEKYLPTHDLSPANIDELYSLTEGNFFFLTEYVSMLRQDKQLSIMNLRLQDTLKNRFIGLSEQEREVVELVSFFYDYVSLQLLAEMINLSSYELAKTIEKLINSNILVEDFVNEEVVIKFSHNRLREYLYTNQLASKKRLIHKEIASVLEHSKGQPSQDPLLLAKIAIHYREAQEWLKALEFQLKYLQNHFNFYHELFPINNVDHELSSVGDLVFENEPMTLFAETGEKLAELKKDYQLDKDYQELVIAFDTMEGRFLIRQGKYEKGIESIQRVIAKSKALKNSDYLLKGYKQMIYYYIQIDDSQKMYHYIELGLNEAIASNNHESIGILLRLKGLNYLMKGELLQAERQLLESINTFTITEAVKEKYSINIAAAYDYLAEIRSIEENYEAAIVLQQTAIDLSENKGAYSSLAVFYINMGIILFGKKDYEQAKHYFHQAYDIYETFPSLWKRPQLEAYLSLINLYQGNYKAVFIYLISSKKYVAQIANPQDLGTIYFAEAMIKRQLTEEKKYENELWKLLVHDDAYYYRKALEHLSPNRNKLETTLLKKKFSPINPS